MENSGEHPNEVPSKKDSLFMRMPNGQFVDVFDLMSHERLTGESRVEFASLRSGDLIAMHCIKDDGTESGLLYKIEDAEWEHLETVPQKIVTGRLQGEVVPEEAQNQLVNLVGSGWGGSTMEPSTIVSGRSPYFTINGREFRAPVAANLKVLRRDENGEFRVINESQMSENISSENKKHNQRIEQIDKLMKRFGFDKYNFRDTNISSRNQEQSEMRSPKDKLGLLGYEDKRFTVQYEAGAARGNHLIVIDKSTGELLTFTYFNSQNEDLLQITFADLKGTITNLKDSGLLKNSGWFNKSFETLSGSLIDSHDVSYAKEAYTTFITSGRLGINAVSYRVNELDATRTLGIARSNTGLHLPIIGIIPDEKKVSVKFPVNAGKLEYPGWEARLQGLIRFEQLPDGSINLVLNGQNRRLKNPDLEIATLLRNLTTQ